jgi:hypothetical protein
MHYTRWLLIGITFFIATYLTIQFYIWSEPFKRIFSYNDNWISYIMVFALVMAITGIFKLLLKWELIATRPKRRKK